MSDDKSHPPNSSPMTWEEKQLEYAAFADRLGGFADEMVALLSAHGEVNWTRIYARFGRDIRLAKTDKSRRKALEAIESIYGGMGSWNDFYLQALGEAESTRTSLSHAISRGAKEMLALIEQEPREPKRSFWQQIFGS